MSLPEKKNDKLEPDSVESTESIQFEIRYNPVASSRKQYLLWLAALSIILAMSAFVIFSGNPLPAQALPFLVALTTAALLGWLTLLLLPLTPGKRNLIRLTPEGIAFPSSFAPDLLFRQSRGWNDIAGVLLGTMFVEGKKGIYEYELESAKNKRKVFIYFKSGGHAAIDLTCLTKEDSEKLFLAIESWCLDFSRAPIPRQKLEEHNDSFGKNQQNSGKEAALELPQTYTELWEQEMQDHFSATNFIPLKKGDTIQEGRFRVVMPLSSGGLSAVYLVESRDKELRVLKEAVIPERVSLREKAREMFSREASLLQKINHPNIARVHDYFVENGRDYLLLDFIAGNTLRQQLAQYGPISESEALEYALDMIALVSYLHDLNPPIIHRDLSPDNLVVKEDGSLVLIDFGAANELIGTATGTLVGKQAYMAPEQFRGKAGKASDIYGIGATLFFLLTGVDPNPLTCSSPRKTNKEVSPVTDSIVASCTEQKIEDRAQSLQDLHARIQTVIEEGGGAILDICPSGEN